MIASPLATARLELAPLVVGDADELVDVLGDPALHAFIGGRPSTLAELRQRYARLVAGSPDPAVAWLNWTVRRTADRQPVGTVQATVQGRAASVAWVVGTAWQGQGYATEAARGLLAWLASQGLEEVEAHVHPDHHASAAVAARAGLVATDELVDGERVWRLALAR